MSDDPISELRAVLLSTARERSRSHRRRRTSLLAGAAAVILVPAAAAATGVIGGQTFTSTFADRSSLSVTTVPDKRGSGTCDRVEYRTAEGVSRGVVLSCPSSPNGPAPDGELPTGFTRQPEGVVMIGRTPRGTASVDVPSAVGAVTFDRAASRFAAQIPADQPMLAIARDADGRELARFSAPPMEPNR
jgi:hypothetical protein